MSESLVIFDANIKQLKLSNQLNKAILLELIKLLT